MFNKNLFDRNAFDRSVSSNNITITITTKGSFGIRLVMQTPIPIKQMAGSGNMKCGLVMQQNIGVPMRGSSTVSTTPILLRMSLDSLKFSSMSKLTPNISVQTPFKVNIGGSSILKVDNRMIILQFIQANLIGAGTVNNNLILQLPIDPKLNGSSVLKGSLDLQLPLQIQLTGFGGLNIRRLSAMNENILELIGINLLPGETVTIDTDLLQVLFGSREDVSSVTNNSVFFELNPGENEITVSTDTNESLEITGIWQNRWL